VDWESIGQGQIVFGLSGRNLASIEMKHLVRMVQERG
jgi:hypothetical protein